MIKKLNLLLLTAFLSCSFASDNGNDFDAVDLLNKKIAEIKIEEEDRIVNIFLNANQNKIRLINDNKIYASKGETTEEQVKDFLKGKKAVQGAGGFVDISQQDPKRTIEGSNSILELGLSHFLSNSISNYTNNKHLLNTAKNMAIVFKSGKMHKPTQEDLNKNSLPKNVVNIYDLVLNHFSWENGHSTELLDFEIAQHFIARERIKSLQAMWK